MSDAPFTLDEYDRKLLYLLDRDSGLGLNKLAKSIKRSKQFTLFRLKRFESEGVITHYTAIVDMVKLGFFSFRIYVRFQHTTREELNKIAEELKKEENIWTITIMHGKWDLAIFLGAKRIEEIHTIWDAFKLRHQKNIEAYNFSLYAPIYNFNRTFFTQGNQEKITRVYGESKPEEIDGADWKIIREYAPNVRRSTLQMSKILRMSPETVGRRIRKLEKKKIICGYKLGLDIHKLGYVSYRVDLELSSTHRNAELFEYCRMHKNIYQVQKTIGGADFEIEGIVRDLGDLLAIIEDIKTRFKGIVKNAAYFSYSTYSLLNYVPD